MQKQQLYSAVLSDRLGRLHSMFLHPQARQPLLDVLVFWLGGVRGGIGSSGFNCCYMRSQFPIGTLGATMPSLATTEALSFSHISGTIVGREGSSDLCNLSLYLCGCLSIRLGSVAVRVGLVFVTFSPHAFLVQRDGERFEVHKCPRASSNQKLLYLPLESFIERRH